MTIILSTVEIDATLIAEARSLGIDIDAAIHVDLVKRVTDAKRAAEARSRSEEPIGPADEAPPHGSRWSERNRVAIDNWNEWVGDNGIPLASHRTW